MLAVEDSLNQDQRSGCLRGRLGENGLQSIKLVTANERLLLA